MARWIPLVVAMIVITIAPDASAYNYESPVGDPCHESLTSGALRKLRNEVSTAAALPTSGDDALVVDDVLFSLDADMRDIGAVSLLIGVREPDLKGNSGIDTQELAGVHGDEDTQREHCLRRSVHDDPTGSADAAAECRAYVRQRLFEAIDEGLDGDGRVNLAARTKLPVTLAFRGRVTLSLPTFYLRLGQAVHTLQDSFGHAFRTADHRRMTVILNWVEVIDGPHEPARDGPAHMLDLDLCRELDEFRAARLSAAREATEAVMRAALDPALSVADKKAAVDTALDDYMGFSPGCTSDNAWCDAPELRYADRACGCSTVGASSTGGWWGLFAVMLFGLRRSRGAR